jgi:hypothetical protein
MSPSASIRSHFFCTSAGLMETVFMARTISKKLRGPALPDPRKAAQYATETATVNRDFRFHSSGLKRRYYSRAWVTHRKDTAKTTLSP